MYFLQFLLSLVASLSASRFIPVFSRTSSSHLILGLSRLLLPSPHAVINSFSSPFDLITWPKKHNFHLVANCCSVSSFSIPNSLRTDSFVLFSVHEILSIFLQIHISQALIFFSILCVFVHDSHPYITTGKISALTSLFFVSTLTCLSFHILLRPFIAVFPSVILRFISISLLPSFSIIDPRNVKLATTSISSPSTSKLSHAAVVIIFVFFMLKYRPAFSLSLFTLLINSTRSFFFPANNVVSSAYLKLFSIFPAIFTPSVVSSNPAFLIILSAYRLNRKGDKMQPCLTPFLTLNFPVSPYSLCLSIIHLMLAIWSRVPRAFLKPAWLTGNSLSIVFSILLCIILRSILLVFDIIAIVR